MSLGVQKAASVNNGEAKGIVWSTAYVQLGRCCGGYPRLSCQPAQATLWRGRAEHLLGYVPIALLRFFKWTAYKMLVTPHGFFLNFFGKIYKPSKPSKVGSQHWILFDLCYITSKGRTNVALRLMVLRLFILIEDGTQGVQVCFDHAVQNLMYLTSRFF